MCVRSYKWACKRTCVRVCVRECDRACLRAYVRMCVRACVRAGVRFFCWFFLRNKKIYIQYNTVYNFLRRKENRKIWLLYKIAGKENESKMSTRKTVTSRVE